MSAMSVMCRSGQLTYYLYDPARHQIVGCSVHAILIIDVQSGEHYLQVEVETTPHTLQLLPLRAACAFLVGRSRNANRLTGTPALLGNVECLF